jgi:GNAT superfamily N-acetyltransferase
MIREISIEEFKPFFGLMAELELGDLFNPQNEEHCAWLQKKIDLYFLRGIRFFGLYELEEPIGFASLELEKGPSEIPYLGQKSELLHIAITPKKRGKGFGEVLLKHVEQVTREEQAYCMYMATYAKDFKVINFYGKQGFNPVATIPDVHGPNDEGMVYMRKILKLTDFSD